ncbi:uncharacterized protein [Periplaneta americana]|uniref:uncharacterized protein n=1 Tax=Periplaneta americana TaxID=6978 RepID=UPI0037E7A251
MAGCLSCGEGSNVSPESVRRWTHKLSNVLLSATARKKFHEYLVSREFADGAKLLEFWEKCNDFIAQAETTKHHSRGWKRKSPEKKTRSHTSGAQKYHKTTLKDEAQRIVQFADSYINFDRAQMEALKSAVESGDDKTIVTAITEVKQAAAEMLEDEGYHAFCQNLLTEQGLLKEGN